MTIHISIEIDRKKLAPYFTYSAGGKNIEISVARRCIAIVIKTLCVGLASAQMLIRRGTAAAIASDSVDPCHTF